MLALLKTNEKAVISVSTTDFDIDELLGKEWLLTNNRGGYASSTVVGCNTRRYHGLLTGSLAPPVKRIMALSNCIEMLTCGGQSHYLSTFEFEGKFAPAGFGSIKQFRRDVGVHFDYQLAGFEITKSIYLCGDCDTVVLVYDFTTVKDAGEFSLRPLLGLRDFHSLQKSYANFCSARLGDGVLITHDVPNSCQLFMQCEGMDFKKDPQWWFNFIYRTDRYRGQDFAEDLWSPGFYKCTVEKPCKVVFCANVAAKCKPDSTTVMNIEALRRQLLDSRNKLIKAAKAKDRRLKQLSLAADQFVVQRITKDKPQTTILAGFPWFADWGRDTFISLPGLLLSTGRLEQAKSVLLTFAEAAEDGMIANRFDDRSGKVHFNSVDASLWFINAAFKYLDVSGDSKTFEQQLLPVIEKIIDSYQKGTKFGIKADSDGLITAGSEQTQLTWMDAKYADKTFTPRFGKAVEVNALWYNALCLLGRHYADKDNEKSANCRTMTEKVKINFQEFFYNRITDYLNDCIFPDGLIDASLRPNQIFAVSLPFSPLTVEQQRSVVETVQKHLLTAFGLRTLNEQDIRYKGRYAGPQQQRDEAYHQGTVWPYLLGPFVEAYLKVNDFSRESREQAQKFIEPLLCHLTEDGCIGSISEIFDGSFPQKPRGCIAQAWSVAELIRAYKLIND